MPKSRGPNLFRVLRIIFVGTVILWFGYAIADAQVAPGSVDEVLGEVLNAQDGGQLSSTVIQLFLITTILSLAPGIIMMVTCLPFMVIVFSIMRQAIGIQQAPPNMMIMSLALFLTFFVMEPVFMQAWAEGLSPYMDGLIDEQAAWKNVTQPFERFMAMRVEPGTLETLADALNRPVEETGDTSFALLSVAFMLSEIKHAFQIGFVIFLPFMVIDLVVASVLMGVGMMMVPPTVVSLPFKLGFFVLADGWLKITEALLRGYAI